MCGICGAVDFSNTPEAGLVQEMMWRLAHRGPDGWGYFRDDGVILGHTRLAIVDAIGGAQPMANEDGTLWIAFNGEIFNYVELADELRSLGHQFRTSSDTEVILHAWEQWGTDSFERFNGQWAFAIWDRRERRLILCRDRMGVRPLYLTSLGGRVMFASEVKALFSEPRVTRELDPMGLAQTLTFWSSVAPTTVFSGVSQLEPGHYAIVDVRGVHRKAYWEPEFPAAGAEGINDLAGNADALREALVRAVRLRFTRSDVPVGAYLSGGLDSAVTAAVIAASTEVPLRTFSLRFADAEYDEGRYQRTMSSRLGTEHEDVVVSPRDIADVFPDVVHHAEAPVLRAAPAPLFLLSRLVRDSGFKVVVTGEGADEVIAGYDIFREARVRQFWARDPGSARRSRASELLYPWMVRSPSQAPAFARSFFGRNLDPDDPAMSHRPRWDATGALRFLLTSSLVSQLPSPVAVADTVVSRMPADAGGWDPLSRAQWLEMTTLLPGYILSSQGDRMLMAHSVEGRFPFLDRDVVALCNAMPGRHKLFGLDEKHVLKRAFADMVPTEILKRAKQPYRAPDAAAFFAADGGPEWLLELTRPEALKAAGVFDPRAVAALLAKCGRSKGMGLGNTDNMRVLAVVSTQLLHEDFIKRGASGSAAGPEQPMLVVDMIANREQGVVEWNQASSDPRRSGSTSQPRRTGSPSP